MRTVEPNDTTARLAIIGAVWERSGFVLCCLLIPRSGGGGDEPRGMSSYLASLQSALEDRGAELDTLERHVGLGVLKGMCLMHQCGTRTGGGKHQVPRAACQ